MYSYKKNVNFRLLSVAVGLLFSVVTNGAEAQNVFIRNAMIFDGTGAEPYSANVLIKQGRIVKIGTKFKVTSAVEQIDAKGMALLPGLIDIHTHWTPEGEPEAFPEIAKSYVLHGITTVNDFHASPESYQAKQEWLQTMTTPHVNYAARVSTPGGHGAVWGGQNMTRWISTPADASRAIEQLILYKPDVIKIFADGWRYGNSAENTSMNEDAMTELVIASHKHQLPVMAHIVTVSRAKIAARAGVDVIVHALQDGIADKELVELMKKNNVIYSPSLAVYEPKPEKLVGHTPEKLAWVQRRQAFSLYNLRTFRDAGIRIALGSDAGMEATPHGYSSLRELELLVEAGLTPTESLIAGTLRGAQAIKMADDRGTIEIGKRADLILVEGKPWQNIQSIRNINTVLIDGFVVAKDGVLLTKQPGSIPLASIAEHIIDDFESPNDRSNLDTQRFNNRDSGIGRTVSISQRFQRASNNNALSLTAIMATNKTPEASVIIPFNRGAVVPVNASSFKGIRFDLRGEGVYFVRVNTALGTWAASVKGKAKWQTVSLPFSKLLAQNQQTPWSSKELLAIEFGGSRAAATSFWMELDNVKFY